MDLKIIVLAKQVPDTQHVFGNAMKKDGTIDRAILPVIFNPEDLNALEQALRLKDRYSNVTVVLLTMGPPRAVRIVREGLFRGADDGYLLTDRVFAGADTLATSYALHMAIKKMGDFDLIISGRQAIDGDTAQVGPQVAEKLKIPQITCVEEIHFIENEQIVARRRLAGVVELVRGTLPLLITVNNSAPECRPRNAHFIQKYKYAKTPAERQSNNKYAYLYELRPYLNLTEWNANDICADYSQCGLSGSPTKVKKIENVVFKSKKTKIFDSSDVQIEKLMVELITNHTIG